MALRLTRDILQGTSAEIASRHIHDLDGNALGASALASLTLTLYDEVSGDIINGRDHQNVLNANGGTVTEDGVLTLRLDPEDTVVLDDDLVREWHIALFEWTWSEGSPGVTLYGKAEVAHRIRNLEKVPA